VGQFGIGCHFAAIEIDGQGHVALGGVSAASCLIQSLSPPPLMDQDQGWMGARSVGQVEECWAVESPLGKVMACWPWAGSARAAVNTREIAEGIRRMVSHW